MLLTRRGFERAADLAAIGALVRRTWAVVPRFNAWTFARFDIWAARRLHEGEGAWVDDLALWTSGDDVVSAAFIGESPGDGVLLLGPAELELVPELLAFVEERAREPLLVEVNESNSELSRAVADRGYDLIDGHFIPRTKVLGTAPQPVRLPAGFTIATLRDDDLPRYVDAVHAVFGRGGTVDAFRYVCENAPSHIDDLGLIVVDEGGVVASFTNVWVDFRLGVAEFEPVGTRPGRQQLGLAAAVMTEAENRLRWLGVDLATVHSWSEAEGANRLYDGLGYQRVDRQRNWRPR
jgi:ribosomal protein S18 acetylase RimI-like enzyme